MRPVRPRRARDPAAGGRRDVHRGGRRQPARGSTAGPATAPGWPSWCGPGSRWPGSRTARCCSRPRSARCPARPARCRASGSPPPTAAAGIGTAGTAAVVEYARTVDRAGRQPLRQRLQRRRPRGLPPGRLPRGRAVRQRAVLRLVPSPSDSLSPCGSRRAPAFLTSALLAVPAAGGLLRQRRGRRARPRRGPSSTTGRTATPPAAAAATTDPDAAAALLEQTATDLPDAALSRRHREGRRRRTPSATVDWTATWDLAAAPDWSYAATLHLQEDGDEWQVVAEPTLVHPELGEGQHLLLTRSLADRAPITDAAGRAAVHADRGGQRRRRQGAGDRPAGPGRRAGRRPRASRPRRSSPTSRPPPTGQFVPVITLRRPDFEKIRAAVFDLPGAVFPTEHAAARADPPVRRRAAGPGRRGHRRGHRGEPGERLAAVRRR